MLRLRHAIERASRRRWLGILVVLFIALLLVLLVFHTLEHGVEDALLTCLAVVAFVTFVVAAIGSLSPTKQMAKMVRGPPGRFAAVVARRYRPPPGSLPLRL
jgi:Na+/citrate or Na+/malate symporter